MMRTLAAQPARRPPPLPPVDSATRSSIRIAVVDDERTLRESCHSVLQAEGYNVALCGRGNEARETLKRSEEHTSELQSQSNLVCRLLLEKKKKKNNHTTYKNMRRKL